MEAKYNEKTGKFNLIYFDAVKAFKGDKYPYGRKQKAWKGAKKPTQKEIKIEIALLLEEGKALEAVAEAEVAKMTNTGVQPIVADEPINALAYFSRLTPDCIAQGKVNSRHIAFLKQFIAFIKTNYPLAALHELKKPFFDSYFNSISDFSNDIQDHNFCYLAKLWNRIINEFEESPIKYINTLVKYGKEEFVKNKLPMEKMPFTVEELQRILFEVIDEEENRREIKEQKFFILYFSMVTGWRIGDILEMKWEQVNLNKHTIRNLHAKTKDKTGQETIIFITPLMKRVLERQAENAKSYPFNTKYVFNIRTHAKNSKRMGNYSNEVLAVIEKSLIRQGSLRVIKSAVGKEMKNYTTHCIRKSVTTELNLAGGFSSERIKYLVGHADNSVEAKHYLKFKLYPERSTRDMLEHMEDLTQSQNFYNILIHGYKGAAEIQGEVVPMTEAEAEHLKLNFWTNEAVDCLRVMLTKGFTKDRLTTFIQFMDEKRLEEEEKFVTPQMVIYELNKLFEEIQV